MNESVSPAPLDVIVERDVPVPMRDGVVLRADVYRPAVTDPLPVLLLRIPYDKQVAQTYCYAHPQWYARQGFIVVIQDTRGRYASDGEFRPLVDEASDGADTIEWCAKLPSSTGKVGTYGFSYPGANQLLAATEKPKGHAAACPAFYLTSMHEGFTFMGGAYALSTMAQWLIIMAPDRARKLGGGADLFALIDAAEGQAGRWSPRKSISQIPLIALNPLTPFAIEALDHAAADKYWRSTHLDHMAAPAELPCLHISGWYDIFTTQSLANYARQKKESKAEQRLLVGPWQHIPWGAVVGEVDYGAEAGGSIIDDYQVAFFRAHLLGDRSKVDALPAVYIFVLGAEKWTSFQGWPPPDAREMVFYLDSKGRANTGNGDGALSPAPARGTAADFFIYNPLNPVPSAGGRSSGAPGITPTGACDQRGVEVRADILCYTSEAFDRVRQIAGEVSVELYASTSAIDTDFTAKLCHVRADGRVLNLLDGIIRGRFAADPTRETLLEPGRVHRFDIRLGSVCAEIAAGEKLRLQISSSNYPAFDRNPNSGSPLGTEGFNDIVPASQTVYHDSARPSALKLAIRNA